MAVKATNQITIVDITDAYNVILTSEAFTFVGNTSGAPAGLKCATQAVAYCGSNQCASVIVDSKNIACPTGISAVVEGNGTSAPTITFTTTATIANACEAVIPITVDDITINKKFSFAVAKTGATGLKGDAGKGVKSTTVTYQASTSGTTVPTGTWNADIPTVAAGSYLWTRTVITYTDNTSSTSYSVGKMGSTGATGTTGSQWYSGTGITGTSTTATVFSGSGVAAARVNDMYLNTSTGYTYKCTVAGAASAAKWVYSGSIKGATGSTGNGISKAEIAYAASTSNTTAPTSGWQSTPPSVSAGSYLWTRTIFTYTNGGTATQYSVANGNINAKKDIGVVGNMWFGQENGILFVTLNDGTILEAINLFDGNNLSIGWGHYSQKKGQVCIGGTDIIHRVSATANNVEYRPYYRRGDSIDVRMGTAGYVTSGTKEFYFTIPLGKPVVGNPSVSISSINGLIMRQNSKYIIKADWVQPDRYSAAVRDNNAIWVIAFWNNATNAANNSPVGIDANIRITFS